MMDVAEAIEILVDEAQPSLRFEKEIAVACFSNWLNSRTEEIEPGEMIFITLLRFIERCKATKTSLDYDLISSTFDENVIFRKLFNQAISIPDFWFIKSYSAYDETKYVSDIVRFMLSYSPRLADKRYQASLGKAFSFINEHGGFNRSELNDEQPYFCSQSTHQIIWKKFKQSSPFQYVRYYDSEIDWIIDPRADNYIEELSRYAKESKKISAYFSRCLWVQQQLQQKIDRRSMNSDDFLILPSNLKPEECLVPAFAESAYKTLRQYRRNRGDT